MGKTPEQASRRISFAETESGMMAGLWHRPTAGFEWRDDLRPLSSGGEVQIADPGERTWWLVPKSKEARRYPVLHRMGLLSDFHRLTLGPSRAAIVAFANKHGSLGHGELLVGRRGDQASTIVFTVGGDPSSFGESLAEWQNEALAFRNLWETWQAVRTLSNRDVEPQARVNAADRAIRDQIEWPPGGAIVYRRPVDPPGALLRGFKVIAHPADAQAYADITGNLPAGDLVAAARFHVQKELNERLRGHINPYLLPFMASKLRFFPDTLLSAIYLRFAFEVSEGIGRTRECAGCVQPFAPGRRDQLYCGKNCRERAGYRRRLRRASSERDLR
jgi:hypothetical protein